MSRRLCMKLGKGRDSYGWQQGKGGAPRTERRGSAGQVALQLQLEERDTWTCNWGV
jgi:hypothetical protein